MPDNLPFHPIAEIFPLLTGPDFNALAADIRANGVLQPILLHRDGRILDGRNRWLACQAAGMECPTITFAGTDEEALRYIVSLNLHRRHLNESQRALIAARLATLKWGQRKSESPIGDSATQAEAAQLLNVGKRSVERARVVLDRGVPELIEAVQKGTMAASKAAEIASFDPARQRRVVVGIEPLARARAACAPNDISCEDQMPRMTEEEFEFASVHSFLEPCPMLSPHQAARAVPTGRRDGVIDMAQRRRKWLGEFLSALGAPDGG